MHVMKINLIHHKAFILITLIHMNCIRVIFFLKLTGESLEYQNGNEIYPSSYKLYHLILCENLS